MNDRKVFGLGAQIIIKYVNGEILLCLSVRIVFWMETKFKHLEPVLASLSFTFFLLGNSALKIVVSETQIYTNTSSKALLFRVE